MTPWSKQRESKDRTKKTLDKHIVGRMPGLDAEVNSPGAGPAEHCTPAQAVHRDGTDQPAPMHTRDAPARIAVTQCQGP